MKVERKKLNIGKKFIELQIKTEEEFENFLKDLQAEGGISDDNVIKITVPASLKEYVKAKELPKCFRLSYEEHKVQERLSTNEDNLEDVIREYVELVAPPELDKEALIKLGLEAIENVKVRS